MDREESGFGCDRWASEKSFLGSRYLSWNLKEAEQYSRVLEKGVLSRRNRGPETGECLVGLRAVGRSGMLEIEGEWRGRGREVERKLGFYSHCNVKPQSSLKENFLFGFALERYNKLWEKILRIKSENLLENNYSGSYKTVVLELEFEKLKW